MSARLEERPAVVVGRLQGRHVLAMLVAFFGTIFAVNGIFLVSALRTYTGVVSVEPYRKGLHYNDRIEAEERQKVLGWRVTLDVMREGRARVEIKDRNGDPVVSKLVSAEVGRPSTNRHDRRLEFVEQAPGVYEAVSASFDDGSWLVGLEVRKLAAGEGEEPLYRMRRRLWLQPPA